MRFEDAVGADFFDHLVHLINLFEVIEFRNFSTEDKREYRGKKGRLNHEIRVRYKAESILQDSDL